MEIIDKYFEVLKFPFNLIVILTRLIYLFVDAIVPHIQKGIVIRLMSSLTNIKT